jgi:hypothetical protein
VRPSFDSVWKSARIVASSPTVVPEACSIVRISLRSCWSAAVRAEFEEPDEPSARLAVAADDPVEPVVEVEPEPGADGHVAEVLVLPVPVPVLVSVLEPDVVVVVPELEPVSVLEPEPDVVLTAALAVEEVVELAVAAE